MNEAGCGQRPGHGQTRLPQLEIEGGFLGVEERRGFYGLSMYGHGLVWDIYCGSAQGQPE